MSPPPLALHPCLDLYGFRVLTNPDRAPVFLFVLCTRLACPGTRLDQAGTPFGLALAPGFFLSLLRLRAPPALNQVQVWVWGWLEASGFLQMVPDWIFSNFEQLDLYSRRDEGVKALRFWEAVKRGSGRPCKAWRPRTPWAGKAWRA